MLGPSGAGKSTLARALVGLVPHVLPGQWRGSLRIGEHDVAETPPQVLGGLVGICFQDPETQLVMERVEDEVAFGLENRGWPLKRMRERVPQALATVGLAGFQERSTTELSGGEQQRLAIADVLAPAPGLLVFDEPTANLDPRAAADTFARLSQLAADRRRTIVVIEHRVDEALAIADAVLVLDGHGGQVAFGEPAAVGARHATTLEALGAWVPSAWRRRGLAGAARRLGPADRASAGARCRPDGPVVVAATGLEVRYATTGAVASRTALDGVSLVLRAGERACLVGPNGSGKSTLLLALAGLRRVAAGKIALDGDRQSRGSSPGDLSAAALAARIGLVFQDPELGFIGRSVAAEVSGLPDARGRERALRDPEALATLDRFALGTLAEVDPFRLSRGEQRRLSIAAAARGRPRALLLDEPTLALDRRGADHVTALLDELREDGGAQLIATHDMRLVARCDRVIALDRGRVVHDGTVDAFFERPPYTPPDAWRPPPDAR